MKLNTSANHSSRSRRVLPAIFSVVLFVVTINETACCQPALQLTLGIEGQRQSASWQQAIASRVPSNTRDSMAMQTRPLNLEELQWLSLIQAEAQKWNSWCDSLNRLFIDVGVPDSIYLLLGFLGNDDGFTYGSDTICFDLTAFSREYGNANANGNRERAGRIFSHEYTHLLQKSWMQKNQWTPVSFQDSIVWECWYEGIGMYRSLKPAWHPVDNRLPNHTRAVLRDLGEVFDSFMKKLTQDPDIAERTAIRKNLSRGRVVQKWGATTVAIWLMLAALEGDEHLQRVVQRGPQMIGYLRQRYGF